MACTEYLASFRIRFCCGTHWRLGSVCSCSTNDPLWLTTANMCGGFRRLFEIHEALRISCRLPGVRCRWDRGGKGGGSRLSITTLFLDQAPSSLILPSASCFSLSLVKLWRWLALFPRATHRALSRCSLTRKFSTKEVGRCFLNSRWVGQERHSREQVSFKSVLKAVLVTALDLK